MEFSKEDNSNVFYKVIIQLKAKAFNWIRQKWGGAVRRRDYAIITPSTGIYSIAQLNLTVLLLNLYEPFEYYSFIRKMHFWNPLIIWMRYKQFQETTKRF